MNFTSVDPPPVVRFVRREYPNVVTHAPKWSIYQRAVERGILPSMKIRWCCADFKEMAGAGKVTLIGIRKSESARRAKRHEVEVSNRKFSGNLDEFGDWQTQELEKKEAKLLRKMKREGKKVNEDEWSMVKENEVRCINGKDSILVSPIFEWTEEDVWYFLNDILGVPHCELYDKGYKRIGCLLCPMSQRAQKMREIQDYPHTKRLWIDAIKQIRMGGGISKRIYLVEHQRGLEQRPQQQQETPTLELPHPSDGMHRYGRHFYNNQFTRELLQPNTPPTTTTRSENDTPKNNGKDWIGWGFRSAHPQVAQRMGIRMSKQKMRLQRRYLIGG